MCLCLGLWGFLPKGSTFTKHLLEHATRDSYCTSPVTTTEVLVCTWPYLAVGLQRILPAVKRNKCTDKNFPSLGLCQTKFLHLFCP